MCQITLRYARECFSSDCHSKKPKESHLLATRTIQLHNIRQRLDIYNCDMKIDALLNKSISLECDTWFLNWTEWN